MKKLSPFLISMIVVGYGFLYVPIFLLILYSFNDSNVFAVFTQFSLRWYETLFSNEALILSLFNSLRIAFFAASIAVIVGTCAAIAMTRYEKFRGKTLFSLLISSPLLMPDVITGLGILLFFIGLEHLIGWPQYRGIITIIIAHATVGIAYVYVVVYARLLEFEKTYEEAALDLGCKPFRVFFSITIPLICPSLIAAWTLAFALSFDDLVISSFLSGPGATTLPMLIFSSLRLGLSPDINALATLIITTVAVCLTMAGFFLHRQKNRKF